MPGELGWMGAWRDGLQRATNPTSYRHPSKFRRVCLNHPRGAEGSVRAGGCLGLWHRHTGLSLLKATLSLPKFLGNAGVGLREETGGFAIRSISVLMLLMLNIPQPAAAGGLRMPQHSPAQSPAQHLSAPWHRTAPAPGCPAWQQLRNAGGEHRMRPGARRSRGEPGEEGSHSTCSPLCRSGVLTCQQRRLLLCRRD